MTGVDPAAMAGWPSLDKIILPSRAFFLSWREQTLPARRTALEDALDAYRTATTSCDRAFQDMALLAVVGEALQPFEDLAYLARAWDQPLLGLATYIRATAYWRFASNNFWQEVPKWGDERLCRFAGLAANGHPQGHIIDALMEREGMVANFDLSTTEALRAAVDATVSRLRAQLESLAHAWREFSPYFLAYKHGGLVINREDTIFVDDDVDEWDEETPRHDPSIAVWTRSAKEDLKADFNLSSAEVVEYALSRGRLAIDLVERFVESRSFIFDALDLAPDGSVRGVLPMQLPWTIWLYEADLSEGHWKLIGRGPRINRIGAGRDEEAT